MGQCTRCALSFLVRSLGSQKRSSDLAGLPSQTTLQPEIHLAAKPGQPESLTRPGKQSSRQIKIPSIIPPVQLARSIADNQRHPHFITRTMRTIGCRERLALMIERLKHCRGLACPRQTANPLRPQVERLSRL